MFNWLNLVSRICSLPGEDKLIKHSNGWPGIIFIIYCISVFAFAAYINDTKCNAALPQDPFSPEFLRLYLKFADEHFLSFMDRHAYYARNIECYKNVLAFAFLLALVTVILLLIFGHDYSIAAAELSIELKNYNEFIFSILFTIFAFYMCIYKIETVDETYRRLRVLSSIGRNIDNYSSQTFRAIGPTIPLILALKKAYAYIFVFLIKRRKQDVWRKMDTF